MLAAIRRHVRDKADLLVYLTARWVILAIHLGGTHRCERYSQLLGRLLGRCLPIRRSVTDHNLSSVFPNWTSEEIRKTRQAMWCHLVLMACEVILAPRKVHRTNWYRYFAVPDRRRLLKLLLGPRPVVMVTGHFGNFELAGFMTGLFGIPTTTIARPLDNRYLHRYVTRLRSAGGQHLLDKDGSAPAVAKLLEDGQTLTLLADQHAGSRGVWVDFLGRPAACHKALALFTLSSQAPMAVMTCPRLNKRPLQFQIECLGVADPQLGGEHLSGVHELTQWYNDSLGSAIHRHPEQYWWLHHRWKKPPPRLQKLIARSKAA